MRQTYDRRTNGGTNCISPTLTSRTDTNSRHAATAPRNKSAIFDLQFPPQVPAINHFALLPCIPCFPWFNSLKPSQIASFTKSTLVTTSASPAGSFAHPPTSFGVRARRQMQLRSFFRDASRADQSTKLAFRRNPCRRQTNSQ